MAEKYPMTPQGQQKLKDELARLKAERPACAKAIEVARGHGDLSENADYDAAKEKQGMNEARIRELETKIALSEVIDPSKLKGDKVMFGATVTIQDTDTEEETTYTIVGEDEADIKARRIAVTAPVARALIGREVGDTVKVNAPKGQREFEIIEVKFDWVG
ncbi:MAG: transcription elongation factor GreA [Deltaproteobacteria bacterium]|nr:transcription elongation factor GreA [Deltaproteobacteria bacterium]